MLRSQRCKLAVDSQSQAYMLYDLASDPMEQRNLVADAGMQGLKRDLQQKLAERLERTGYAAALK
jgi:arylsulfatase A-like enzyme